MRGEPGSSSTAPSSCAGVGGTSSADALVASEDPEGEKKLDDASVPADEFENADYKADEAVTDMVMNDFERYLQELEEALKRDEGVEEESVDNDAL